MTIVLYNTKNLHKLQKEFDHAEIAFLNKVISWLKVSGKKVEGYEGLWIYNTLAEWARQLSVSVSKIQKAIKKFKLKGILLTESIGASNGNQTKWYSIDSEVLQECTNTPYEKNTPNAKTLVLKRNQFITKTKDDKVGELNKIKTSIETEEVKSTSLEEPRTIEKKVAVVKELFLEEKKIAKIMVDEWNKAFHDSPSAFIGRVNNQSAPQLAKIWEERFNSKIERWQEYISIIRHNDYAMQQTDKFKGNFTWAIKDETVIRMLKYNRSSKLIEPDMNTKVESTNIEVTAKKIYSHKPTPFGVKNQLYISNNKLTKQINSSNCNYEKEEFLEAKEIGERMKNEWNKIFSYSKNPIEAYVTEKNVFKFKELWQDVFNENIEKWREYARSVNSSGFLMGEKTSFKAHFSWLLKHETVQKVMAGEYNVGDRVIDEKNIEKNLTAVQNEVVYEVKERIQSKLDINHKEERQYFNDYIMNRQFMYDPDPYQVKDLFNNTYLNPNTLITDEKWRQLYNATFSSYLAKKYLKISADDISKMVKEIVAKSDKSDYELLMAFKAIKTKLKTGVSEIAPHNLPALLAF